MVYINKDGSLGEVQPWNLTRLFGLFTGTVAFVVFFFKSLLGMETATSSGSSKSNSSGGWSSKGGGGGGSGPGGRPFGPGGGGGGPKFRSMADINKPTVSAGGCPGGSCGM